MFFLNYFLNKELRVMRIDELSMVVYEYILDQIKTKYIVSSF